MKTMMLNKHVFRMSVLLLILCFGFQNLWADEIFSNKTFQLKLSKQGVVSLKRIGDPKKIEFIRSDKQLGNIEVKYRVADGPVRTLDLSDSTIQIDRLEKLPGVIFQPKGDNSDLALESRIALGASKMIWLLNIKNTSSQSVEILDVALPLDMNTSYEKGVGTEETFTRRLIKHAHIAGSGSFIFWLPVGGVGTHLVMIPDEQTRLEYYEENFANYARGGGSYKVYIHSTIDGGRKKEGTWRQPHTKLKLAPGEEKKYGFQFFWADDYTDIRNILYQNGGFDIRISPGMVVPEDLTVKFALRSRNDIEKIVPEYALETQIEYIGKEIGDYHIYQVNFSKLGENLLTVYYGNNQTMPMEFFVTQSLETLITKRASFIVNAQQHKDPSKWYNGLYSLWDVRREPGENLLGPENTGGQYMYAVSGSDDPSTGKPVFLSEKNVVYPDPTEIASLEYHLEHFSWGKHQRTDKEYPYPYGVYGSEHWKENREAMRDPIEKGVSRPGKGGSQCRMWRTFDYTHYILLYYNMYRIASQNPEMVHYLDAKGYLERAFGSAKAYFQVPYNIYMEGGWAFTGWTDWAYKLGNFHEKYLLKLIVALEKEGQQEKADYLRNEWEKKVKYFLYDDPYPFVSEMPVDSTAYESSYAIAKYAMTHELKPDEKLWKDKNTNQWYSHPKIDPEVHRVFMKDQLYANLACRGFLETSYYHLGSDFRALGSSGYCLSYMSQMGGWAVLDYALEFAKDPSEFIGLGYASMLSSWALVNSGDEQSNYGYWFPGKLLDGAVGWGFCPQKIGQEWNRGCWNKEDAGVRRGIWPVCGEIDHGLTAGVEAACTVIYDDPILGWYAYGGILEDKGEYIKVNCRDGVRQRIYFVNNDSQIQMFLDRDGFDSEAPVIIFKDITEINFNIESRNKNPHITSSMMKGFPRADYVISVDDKVLKTMNVCNQDPIVCQLPVPANSKSIHVNIKKK